MLNKLWAIIRYKLRGLNVFKMLRLTREDSFATRINSEFIKYIERDNMLMQLKETISHEYPDSIINQGFSVYSQNDEDGIIAFIFGRLGVKHPYFFEFGVHPAENNSLNLLLKNSRGVWYDKSLTRFKKELGERKSLLIIDEYLNITNIKTLCDVGIKYLGIDYANLDFLSMDLDGNDFYFIECMQHNNIKPKLLCLEYNAKFRLPDDIKIMYNDQHRWLINDYFGCSLQAYINLLKQDYYLIACNITGSNCFFIRQDFANQFVINDPNIIYMPPRYYLSPIYKGHKSSVEFLKFIK